MKAFTKLIAVLLAAVMCLCVFSACAVKTDPPAEEQTPASDPAKTPDAATEQAAPASDVTLEIEVDWTDDNLAAFTALMDKFTAETGIKTEIVSVGEEIETQLKIRMASNDMPDLWVTHGWSLIRYKDFLTDLSGESWVSDISDAAAGVITDTDGRRYHRYSLPSVSLPSKAKKTLPSRASLERYASDFISLSFVSPKI